MKSRDKVHVKFSLQAAIDYALRYKLKNPNGAEKLMHWAVSYSFRF